MRHRRYRNRILTVTGPEALTMTQLATAQSYALGMPIRFEEQTLAEAYTSRTGAPENRVDLVIGAYRAIAAGEFATITPDFHQVMGAHPLDVTDALSTLAQASSDIYHQPHDGPWEGILTSPSVAVGFGTSNRR